MSDPLALLAPLVSGLLLLLVVELVRRRALREEYSLAWILTASALLALSLWRGILHQAAHWLGIFYPPAVLLLVVTLCGFVAALYFSVVVSRQRAQIERLVEDVAILSAQMRELRDREPRREDDRSRPATGTGT